MLNILQPHLQQQLQADALVIMMKQHINLYLTYYIGFNASRKKTYSISDSLVDSRVKEQLSGKTTASDHIGNCSFISIPNLFSMSTYLIFNI